MQAPKTEHDPSLLWEVLHTLEDIDRAHFWLWTHVKATGDNRHTLSTEVVWEKYRAWGLRDPMSEAHFIYHAENLGLEYDPVEGCFLGVIWRHQSPSGSGLTTAEVKRMNSLSADYRRDVSNGAYTSAYRRMEEMQALRREASLRLRKPKKKARRG